MTTNDNQGTDNVQASSGIEGVVYVLTNPAMPGLVKIGKTTQSEISARLSQLYTTGVPLPFDCEYAVKVADMTQVENALHFAFGDNRINLKREFFEIDPDRVKAILDILKLEDVTPGVDEGAKESIDAADKVASANFKKRRPSLNFGELDIPVGAVLEFVRDSEETATVANGTTRVNYQGNDHPISGLTATLLDWQSDYVPNSGKYWNYGDRNLQDIYNETHGF